MASPWLDRVIPRRMLLPGSCQSIAEDAGPGRAVPASTAHGVAELLRDDARDDPPVGAQGVAGGRDVPVPSHLVVAREDGVLGVVAGRVAAQVGAGAAVSAARLDGHRPQAPAPQAVRAHDTG